jgi:hypothetical protein
MNNKRKMEKKKKKEAEEVSWHLSERRAKHLCFA